jgi:putative transposase
MVIVFGALRLVGTLVQLLGAARRSRPALAAENLFLRRQLALYRERNVEARRADRLAQCVGHRPTTNFDWLASRRLWSALATEI